MRQELCSRLFSATSCPNMGRMLAVSVARSSRRFVHWQPIVEQNMQNVVAYGSSS